MPINKPDFLTTGIPISGLTGAQLPISPPPTVTVPITPAGDAEASLKPPVLDTYTSVPVPPQKKDERAALRNELIIISEKFFTYGVIASVEMIGMYFQRLFSDGADKIPLYNPDAPAPSVDPMTPSGALETANDKILRVSGKLASVTIMHEDFATVMSDPELRAAYHLSGDRWYSIGNLLKFTAQYFFSYMYKGDLGFHTWMAKVAANHFSPQKLANMESDFTTLFTPGNFLKRVAVASKIMALHWPAAAFYQMGEWAKAAVSPSSWTSAGKKIGVGLSAMGASLGGVAHKGMTLTRVIFNPAEACRLGETFLSSEEQAVRQTHFEKSLTASSFWDRTKAKWDLFRSGVSIAGRALNHDAMEYVSSKEIEPLLANAQAKRSFATATEKLMKFVAPTTVVATQYALNHGGFAHNDAYMFVPALPLLAVAHGAILFSGYYVVQGNTPKILKLGKGGDPMMLGLRQELLSGLGIYLGKTIQSAYTLCVTGEDILKAISGDSQIAAQTIYHDLLQAGKNMPAPLILFSTALAVGPALYSFKTEAVSFVESFKAPAKPKDPDAYWAPGIYDLWDGEKSILQNLQDLKVSSIDSLGPIDRSINGMIGLGSVGAALAGAFYMGDFQTQTLTWAFCGISASLTGVRLLHKKKEIIKDVIRQRISTKKAS